MFRRMHFMVNCYLTALVVVQLVVELFQLNGPRLKGKANKHIVLFFLENINLF